MKTDRNPETAGFVLAGGQSRRMGTDKALLPFGEATLLEHLAREVEVAAGSVTIIGPPSRYRQLGWPVLPDEVSGLGPLGGLVTALAATQAKWSLVTACDLPDLSAGFLSGLLQAAALAGNNCDCYVAEGPNGLEPLCAAWNIQALPKLRCAVANGQRKMKEVIAALHARTWTVGETAVFRNVNTPQDWAD